MLKLAGQGPAPPPAAGFRQLRSVLPRLPEGTSTTLERKGLRAHRPRGVDAI